MHSLPHVQSKISMCSSQAEDASTVLELSEDFYEPSTPETEHDDSEPEPLQGTAWRGRWRLVWCHERVHKQDREADRKALSAAARQAGAALVSLKKASNFQTWLSRARRPPYVLVTDWREAKPCLQAASAHPGWQRPCLMVVVAEHPRHFERASRWVAALPPSGEVVRVRQDIGLATDFVESAQEHLCTRSGHSREERRLLPVDTAPASAKDSEQLQGLAGTCIEMQSPRQPEVPVYCFPSAAQEERRLLPVDTAPASGKDSEQLQGLAGTCIEMQSPRQPVLPVFCFLSPAQELAFYYSPAQIEHMLRQAVPDHYDD